MASIDARLVEVEVGGSFRVVWPHRVGWQRGTHQDEEPESLLERSAFLYREIGHSDIAKECRMKETLEFAHEYIAELMHAYGGSGCSLIGE